MLLHATLICLHVMAAAFWVGGMAVMHAIVRPVVAERLEMPSQRLAMMSALLTRFVAAAGWAVGLLLLSGAVMIGQSGGFGDLHASTHAMVGLGLLMTLIYARIRWALLPRLRAGVAASDPRAAAKALASVRGLVVINLVLGSAVFVIALVGRVLF